MSALYSYAFDSALTEPRRIAGSRASTEQFQDVWMVELLPDADLVHEELTRRRFGEHFDSDSVPVPQSLVDVAEEAYADLLIQLNLIASDRPIWYVTEKDASTACSDVDRQLRLDDDKFALVREQRRDQQRRRALMTSLSHGFVTR